jgi:hypothetical protein
MPAIDAGTVIVQCKHFVASGFSKPLAHLRNDELPNGSISSHGCGWKTKRRRSIGPSSRSRFTAQGLDIKPYRALMRRLDKHGHDIEFNFKAPAHELQLVFVCAMWLTGFDAPTLSTLYLDKPMQGYSMGGINANCGLRGDAVNLNAIG